MKLLFITKSAILLTIVVCFMTMMVTAHRHHDCDEDVDNWDDYRKDDRANRYEEDHENEWDDHRKDDGANSYEGDHENVWDEDEDTKGDDGYEDNDREETNNEVKDGDGALNQYPIETSGTKSGPVPTINEQPETYAAVTVTATHTKLYTVTGVPSNYNSQPQATSMSRVNTFDIYLTVVAILLTILHYIY